MNKKRKHPFQNSAGRLTTILLSIAIVTIITIILLVILLNGMANAYVTNGTQKQQEYCNQLADTLSAMKSNGVTDEELVEYMVTHVTASGGSWAFVIEDETVLFAKNKTTTDSLTTLKERDAFLENLKEQNGILTSSTFEYKTHSYTVGMITERSQFLNQSKLTTYQVYLILLFAVLLLISIGAITALSGAWTKSEGKLTDIKEELLERNQEFEKLEELQSPMDASDPITIHHSGKSTQYKQYKFKFYLNARHAIYIDGVLGAMHPHTWEITLHVIKMQQDFIQFTKLEKEIEAFIDQFQDKELNEVPPFDMINPTLENCCDYFKEQLSIILNNEGWLFLMMEMSETPSRSYVISMIDEEN